MLQRQLRHFPRKTRTGKIVNHTKEHYTRNDIHCGSTLCTQCKLPKLPPLPSGIPTQSSVGFPPPNLSSCGPYYLLDTNVFLHQLDLLTHLPSNLFTNVILLQTVLDEVKHNNYKLYTRVRGLLQNETGHNYYLFYNEFHSACYIGTNQPGESANDRNDRAIRMAAKWLHTHLQAHGISVVLVTEDRGNELLARECVLSTLSMKQFVEENAQQYPQLLEYAARLSSEESVDGQQDRWIYDEHLSADETTRLLQSGQLVRGTFRVSRDYWSEGSVNVRGFSQPVFIPDVRAMNRAVDGDIVAVQLLDKTQWRAPTRKMEPAMEEPEMVNITTGADADSPVQEVDTENNMLEANVSQTAMTTGRVVSIIQRNWRPYCGSLEVSDKKQGKILFLSVNKRIPRIRIESKQIELLMDKRILVQIDSWPRDSKFPLGHYVKTIGTIGDKDTETSVLLIEHDIPTAPWTNSVLACLPEDTHNIDPKDLPGRDDFRTIPIFSIDPPGCTDIDDALHVVKLPNGNLQVGVHIADVSHYVKPNSALDAEAAYRGTSVYLVERRIDMLPSLLSTNLCSLKSDIDRLTFSVLWEMDSNANIIHTSFHKAVVRSRHSFTYAQAQERIDSGDTADPISWACITLNTLARKLKQKRIDAGALMLASSEVKFLIDRESQTPTDVEMYQLKEANSLVEEFMLLANVSVAKHVLQVFPTFALLRKHPEPSKENFLPLVRAAKIAGFDIRVDTSKNLADSLDQAVIPDFPFFNKLIRIMATRCMSQAVYFSSGDCSPSDYFHYGLASPVYTHFTSPIRRYADIVVHRLLAACLGFHPLPKDIQDREKVRDMAENINHRHRMAQLVSRASTELFTLIYFNNKTVTETGLITSLRNNGIRVMIPRYGIETAITLFKAEEEAGNAVSVQDLPDAEELENPDEERKIEPSFPVSIPGKNPYVLDEENMCLKGPNGQKFKIFEQVQVEISVKQGKNRRKWLSVELVDKASTVTKEIHSHAQQQQATPQYSMMDEKEAVQVFVSEEQLDQEEEEVQLGVRKTPSQSKSVKAISAQKKPKHK